MLNPASLQLRHNSRRLAIALLLAAWCISTFLLAKSLLDNPIPGCAEGAGCHIVLTSKWAYLAGLPVSIAGTLLYGALMILAGITSSQQSLFIRKFEIAACLLILFGAIWFTLVQIFILHAYCPWCCSAHLLASIAAVLLLSSRKKNQVTEASTNTSFRLFRAETIIPLLIVAAFAFFQASTRSPENVINTTISSDYGITTDGKRVSVYGGQLSFDPSTLPVIGSPNAEKMIIVLTDFTCPHCRSLHNTLEELVQNRGGDVGIVLLPAYRDPAAEELHRVMLTLWKEDPTYYETLSSGMINKEIPADPNKILTLALSNSSGRFYEKAWHHASWVDQSLQLGQRLLKANDERLETPSLPQIMIGGRILQGEPRQETLSALLDQPNEPTATPPALKADHPDRISNPEADSKPMIEFASNSNIPKVPRGEVATTIFTFTNNGTAPLKILKVKKACGCTVVEGWKQTVPPGQTGSFKVSLNTSDFVGKVTKRILVTSNATNVEDGVSTLYVKADAWLPIRLSSYNASYGTILTGETAKPMKITMTLHDDGPFKIGQPVCSNPYFKTTWSETKPGKEYLLTITIPKLHRNREKGDISIPLGHPKYPVLKIPAYARVADPVEASPNHLILPRTRLRTPMRRLVTILCHDRKFKDFNITEFKVIGLEGITLSLKPRRSKRWQQIEVTLPSGFDPTKAIAQKTAIYIETNHPKWKKLTVPLQIQGQQ